MLSLLRTTAAAAAAVLHNKLTGLSLLCACPSQHSIYLISSLWYTRTAGVSVVYSRLLHCCLLLDAEEMIMYSSK